MGGDACDGWAGSSVPLSVDETTLKQNEVPHET